MRKRIYSLLTITTLSLILITGCSKANEDKEKLTSTASEISSSEVQITESNDNESSSLSEATTSNVSDETLTTNDTTENTVENTTEYTTQSTTSKNSESKNKNSSSNKNNNSTNSSNNKNNGGASTSGNAVGEKDSSKLIQTNTNSSPTEAQKLAKAIIDKIITKGMSDFDKAKAIHDYLIINVDYDYQNYLNDTIPRESYTALGALKNKYAVCAGYATAYKLLCDKAELECIYVVGDTPRGSHAWNQVKVDGKWYNVDTTWDDPVSTDKKFDDHKFNRYSYFLISDDIMYKDHTPVSQVNACSSSLMEKAYETPVPWATSTYTKVTNEEEIRAVVKKAMDEESTAISVMFDTDWMSLNDMKKVVEGIMLEFVARNFSMSLSYYTIKNTDLCNVTFNIKLQNGKYTKQPKLMTVDEIKDVVKYLSNGNPYETTRVIDNSIATDENFYNIAIWAYENLNVSIGFHKSSVKVSSVASAYLIYAHENSYYGSHHVNKAYDAKKVSDILTILSNQYTGHERFRVIYRYGDEIGRLSADEIKAYVEKNLAPTWASKYCFKSYKISVNDFVCVMEIEFNTANHNTSGAKWEYSPAPTCIHNGAAVTKCLDCHNIVSRTELEATGVHETYWVYDSDITKHLACKHCSFTGPTLQQYGQVWGYFDNTAKTTLFNDINKRRETEKYIQRDYMGNFVAAHDLPQLSWNDKLANTLRTFAVCHATADIEHTQAQVLENAVYTIRSYAVKTLYVSELFDSFNDLDLLQNPNFTNAGTVCFYYDYDGTGLKLRQVWAIAFSE